MSWHSHVAEHGRQDILHLQLTLAHCLVQAWKMRSAHASGPEGRDLRTVTKDIVFMPPFHGLWWNRLWEQQMTFCQTAAWQLACLMCKESAFFVGGRISGINYELCDSWLTGPGWQCLTFAHSILKMKSSASQKDHPYSVISADLSTDEKHSSKILRQGCQLTSSAGMKYTPPCLKLLCLNDPVVWIRTCYLFI